MRRTLLDAAVFALILTALCGVYDDHSEPAESAHVQSH